MNGSYKCAQCGLVNWTIDDFCKRCGIPNPLTGGAAANNFQTVAPAAHQAFAPPANVFRQKAPPVRAMPDYSSPPPPNVFGNHVGTANVENFNDFAPPVYQNRPPVRSFNQQANSPEFEESLKKANKQIRDAWICGVIICAMTLAISMLMISLAPAKALMPVSPAEMILSVIVFGGLTLGVYFKNRGCAIAICVLYILDKIVMTASSGNVTGILFMLGFTYYFAYGIQGTFAYHKLMKESR